MWAALTRIREWPTWNPGITRAGIAGPLEVRASFEWETAGLAITSTVRELIPGERLVWDGTVGGILGIHAWTFTPRGGGTLVRTEESWEEGAADSGAPEMRNALDTSLAEWLTRLKERVEGTTRSGPRR